MFRRLCIDVDNLGYVLGASVEFYSERDLHMGDLLVMEPGWTDGLSPEEAFDRLLREGTIQPPLPGIMKE